MIRVAIAPTFESFREKARPLLAAGVPPEEILWEDRDRGQSVLFDRGEAPAVDSPIVSKAPRVPARAIELARIAVFHGDPDRFALLYRLFHRITRDEPHLLSIAADSDVARLRAMVQSVRHDEHKMHAFVRFRQVDVEGGAPWLVAWYRPEHPIVKLAAPFFARRFASMRWSILTPDESAHWNGEEIHFGPGVPRDQAPPEDAYEEMFRTYYKAIFNPARVNLEAMKSEMPMKFWSSMPETRVLNELVRDAALRVERMQKGPESAAFSYVPSARALPILAEALSACRACALCERATQAVFGEAGSPNVRMMLIGEQPGDEEDRAGRPFVGPAGKVLDEALARAGIERAATYVTNAVKHFKFEPRGKRRIHQRPLYEEVRACRAWLDAEIETVKPEVIVCLGSTAAQSFFGKRFQISKRRGELERTRWAPGWMATWHPSAILRAPDVAASQRMFDELASDLASAKEAMDRLSVRA